MKQLYRYLPLSDEVRARTLFVLAAGSAHLPPGTSYPPETHPEHHRFQWSLGRVLQEYQMIYIAHGGGVLETKTGGRQPVRAGDLFVLFPDEWHRYTPDPETGWEEHWAAFQGRGAAALVAMNGVSPESPVLRTEVNELLLRELARIAEEVEEEAVGYQNVVSARIQLTLALAAASHQRRSLGAADALEIVKRAKEALLASIDKPVDMEALAEEMNVGYSWLRKMFRVYTGLPLAQYGMQLRVNHAAELLRGTTLSVSKVGRRCGFESAYYFARVFRSKFDCSPSEYRARSQKPAS